MWAKTWLRSSEADFSNEGKFSLSKIVNKQNCCECEWTSMPNPEELPLCYGLGRLVTKRNHLTFLLWNLNITGKTYKNMIRYYAFPILRKYPGDIFFEHDDASLSYAVIVRPYWAQKLPNLGMERAGPIPWPTSSPDLTPCVYILWRYLKDIEYCRLREMIQALKDKITKDVCNIGEDTLKDVFRNMKSRLWFVLREEDGHFEHAIN